MYFFKLFSIKDYCKIFKFIYFWLRWVLCCCMQAFFSCGELGLLSRYRAQVSYCSGFSCPGAQGSSWLQLMGSVVAVHGLSCSAACSCSRNQIHVPCIGRLILNRWTTREVLLQGIEYSSCATQ